MHDFGTSANDGVNSYAQPFESTDGNLYGTSNTGSFYGVGSVYEALTGLPPVISLTASSSDAAPGSSTTLVWAVNNAYSKDAQACIARSTDGSWTGLVPASGSAAVTPTGNSAVFYSITCGGRESATIIVNGDIPLVITSTTLPSAPIDTAYTNFDRFRRHTSLRLGHHIRFAARRPLTGQQRRRHRTANAGRNLELHLAGHGLRRHSGNFDRQRQSYGHLLCSGGDDHQPVQRNRRSRVFPNHCRKRRRHSLHPGPYRAEHCPPASRWEPPPAFFPGRLPRLEAQPLRYRPQTPRAPGNRNLQHGCELRSAGNYHNSLCPAGTVGAAYSQTLAVSGGTAPYAWSISSGDLPAGLSLASATGVLSGTPTFAETSNFTVKVVDSESSPVSATAVLNLLINPAPPLRLHRRSRSA